MNKRNPSVESVLIEEDDKIAVLCTAKVFSIAIGETELVEEFSARRFRKQRGSSFVDTDLWKVGRHAACNKNRAILYLLDQADAFHATYDVSNREN